MNAADSKALEQKFIKKFYLKNKIQIRATVDVKFNEYNFLVFN